jgi:hypothetical protein
MSFLRKNSMLLAFSAVSAIALAIGCSQSSDDSESSEANDTQGDGGSDAAQADAGPAAPPSIVISQVYGAGGNTGALFQNDFVELFNVTDNDIDISGMTVQYAAAAGNFSKTKNTATIPAGTPKLQAGQYFLMQFSGGTVGQPLPHPDYAVAALPDGGTPPNMLSLATAAGKVALLAAGAAPLDGCGSAATQCVSATILDLVGYGTTSQFHGVAAPTLTATTAAVRFAGGCTTDPTKEDFVSGAPNPRNTASTKSPKCSDVDAAAPPPPPAAPDAGADSGTDAGYKPPKPPKGSSSSSGGSHGTTAGDDDDDDVTPPDPKGSGSSTHPSSSGSTTNGAKPPGIAATSPDCNMSPGSNGSTGLAAIFGLALVGASLRRRKQG